MKIINHKDQAILAHAIAWVNLNGDMLFIKLTTADSELVRWRFASEEEAENFYYEMLEYIADPTR